MDGMDGVPAHTVPSRGKCSRDSRRNLKCLKFWWRLGWGLEKESWGKRKELKVQKNCVGKK